MLQAHLLSDLYWFTCVIEAGSFSAAASRTGVAKSSLSRRLTQLEQQLGVQLLSRSSRQFMLTGIGEKVYQHALNMLAAAEAATHSAQDALGTPSGLLRLAAPSILCDWLLERMGDFRQRYPQVSYDLTQADDLIELRPLRLDLSLSLDAAPRDSAEIVARPLALLHSVLVAAPRLLESLSHPQHQRDLDDHLFLTCRASSSPQAWLPGTSQRALGSPALTTDNLLAVRQAAMAGLGLAALPLFTCEQALADGSLRRACPQDQPPPATLYALTPPHRSVTPTARQFLQELRASLIDHALLGVDPVDSPL